MSAPTPDSAADLLTELDGLGIQLEAHGEQLRFRPREKVTADLADRMKMHKARRFVFAHVYNVYVYKTPDGDSADGHFVDVDVVDTRDTNTRETI